MNVLILSWDGGGNTPLHYAAFKGNKESVQLLLEKGAKLDLPNKDGRYPEGMMTDTQYLSSVGFWGIPVKNRAMMGGQIQLDPVRSEIAKLLGR